LSKAFLPTGEKSDCVGSRRDAEPVQDGAAVKLTQAIVTTLTADKPDQIIWDDDLPGFGIRIRNNKIRSWVVQYRFEFRARRFTLGSVAVLPLVAARAEAKKYLAAVQLGRDPMTERRAVPYQNLKRRIAHKALSFLNQDLEPECYLYRHYHPDGDLPYVGMSLAPLRRQDQHLKAAGWRIMICRILIEPFATREEASAAEEEAIQTEFPKFNIVHNRRRHPIQELAKRVKTTTPKPVSCPVQQKMIKA
jgi:Arm DNA-binding domain